MVSFPDLNSDAVLTATDKHWDISGALPVPHGSWLKCPVCWHSEVQPRHWRFHMRDSPTLGGRCDVSFKCTACAGVWYHGIALDKQTWMRMSGGQKRLIDWREARELLQGS